MARFLNPYNFVRPLPKPTPDADNPDHQLLWRCPPPPHDRYTGLSGRIICTMHAETPVFVSDSEGISSTGPSGKEHHTYRFFQIDGRDIIPASGLRGAIRSVFEAATNSTWGIFTDQTLSFRAAAHDARGMIPGCIDYDVEQKCWVVVLMTGGSQIGRDGIPEGLPYAATLPQYYRGRKADRNVPLNGIRHGQLCYAALQRTQNHWTVRALDDGSDRQRLKAFHTNATRNGWQVKRGVVCITGKNIGNKNNERFFFTEGDETRAVPKREIERYNESIKSMREYHQDRDTDKRDLSRYHVGSLDEELLDSQRNPLLQDDGFLFPVYVRLDRRGQVEFLAPVTIPRVLEQRAFFDIMREEGFGHLLPAYDFDALSPADRVFGWVRQQEDDTEVKERVAYRGRVRFSHAEISGELPRSTLSGSLSILSTPKPTTTRFYVDLPGHISPEARVDDEQLRYSKSGVRLRGRKMYRHHAQFDEGEAFMRPDQNSHQNRSIEGAHPAGTTYTFTVEFENLQPVELGALLWALELHDEGFQGYHRIGYGKPLGLGSVAIEVTELALFDQRERYTELGTLADSEADGLLAHNGLIEPMKVHFMAAFFDLYAPVQTHAHNFWELDNIADLATLLSEPENLDLPIHYPRSHVRRSASDNNYEWFVNNKRVNRRDPQRGGPQLVLPYAVDDTTGLPYLYWDSQQKRVVYDD